MPSRSAPDRNRCPICRARQRPEHRPFCSPACRDRDLLQWLGEGYRLPMPPAEQAAEEADG